MIFYINLTVIYIELIIYFIVFSHFKKRATQCELSAKASVNKYCGHVCTVLYSARAVLQFQRLYKYLFTVYPEAQRARGARHVTSAPSVTTRRLAARFSPATIE